MTDPKMTKFIAMILDEKTTTIKQSAQEALPAREEMLASEATFPQVVAEETKNPYISPMQHRGVC
jgi:hypothetical protein